MSRSVSTVDATDMGTHPCRLVSRDPEVGQSGREWEVLFASSASPVMSGSETPGRLPNVREGDGADAQRLSCDRPQGAGSGLRMSPPTTRLPRHPTAKGETRKPIPGARHDRFEGQRAGRHPVQAARRAGARAEVPWHHAAMCGLAIRPSALQVDCGKDQPGGSSEASGLLQARSWTAGGDVTWWSLIGSTP